ncbi:MAG: DHH family phosphoesterase, partial [Clostridia bacterium]|nr:DHH family phosphoesterase [Clostridia bacterium]
SDREAGAREALSMALARGGDQVAYKSEAAMEFFGGNTRPVQKRSSVAAKMRSVELITRISRASGVIIMGHRGADQDCLGASVGIARLAMYCYVKPYIVVDKNDRNTANFMKKFEKLAEYADVFVDENEAQDLINSDTLLTVVDVNNIDHMLSSAIALAVNDAINIDHHRKTDSQRKRDWLMEYIEPSASSASELVAEILEQSIGEGHLLKEEADALLGGILLDTKQFTKSTGTRTFNAAIYLRSSGASIYESAKELKSEFGEFKKQSRILSDLVIYKNRFVIAKDEEPGEPIDRIAAAKAAETLLSIKGVDAAFALIRIGEETHISARSNASVSVQLILEKMGGGGHLDSAGAKSQDPMLHVLEQLKCAIDKYLEENSSAKK